MIDPRKCAAIPLIPIRGAKPAEVLVYGATAKELMFIADDGRSGATPALRCIERLGLDRADYTASPFMVYDVPRVRT